MVRYQGDDPLLMNKLRIVTVISIVLILSIVLTRPPQTHAQFVIASWDYPDGHGQGIFLFQFYENSTGSWVISPNNLTYDKSPNEVEWNASVGIKLRCWTHFNYTFNQVASVEIGKNYQRHNITVTLQGETVFSQENFTFGAGISGPPDLYAYGYDVVLNLIPVAGAVYVVNVSYEIYYLT